MMELNQEAGESLVLPEEEKTASGDFWRNPLFFVAILLLLLLAGAAGYWLKASEVPGPDSADVGFARDMSDHHAQAVEMSNMLYDRTGDEEMRFLAYDILTSQQAQIGIMSGWLDIWGYRSSKFGPKMEWMGMPVTGLMPGMATREQLNELLAAEGEAADAIYMQLMIPHHRAGVQMALAAAEMSESESTRNLALGMAEAQELEIAYMQDLLQEKGFEPVPDNPGMLMEGHEHDADQPAMDMGGDDQDMDEPAAGTDGHDHDTDGS